MELIINIEDLSDLTIKSSTGIVYRLVKDEPIEHEVPAQAALTKKVVNQTELRKLYKCGHTRIKRWVAQGLSEIHDGESVMYDLEEVEEFLKNKKI